jgi:uncharacterized protein (DUF1501 family)
LKRSSFIKIVGSGVVAGSMGSLFESCSVNQTKKYSDDVLVVVRVKGGMDGYHLISPKENDLLLKLRPNIQKTIEEKGINYRNNWFINPNFAVIADLIEKGWLQIIPNVGYSDYNRLSHFKAQDYWETGSVVGDKVQHRTGWAGRLVDNKIIQVNGNKSPILIIDNEQTLFDKGENSSGVYYTPYNTYSNLFPFIEDWINENKNSLENEQIYQRVEDQYRINQLLKETSPNSVSSKDMKAKLDQIADCIEKELPFRVYNLTQSGYDTHHKQTIRLEPLALDLFNGLNQFAERLQQGNNWGRVKVLVYTEFGRTIAENSNGGTDHGTANHTYLLGGNLGDKWLNPSFEFNTMKIAGNDYLTINEDFREIYKSLI